MLHAGDVFAGYVIERRLGGGGMGEVWLARHPRLPRLVALKLLHREFGLDPEVRARFEREADLIARLDHPNIVSVHDRGVEHGLLWISMQYIDGADASALTPAELSPERAVHIVAEIAKALDYAHAMGVLHRDVKPANIMLARPAPGYGERILLADFGIGRLRDDTKNITRTGSLTLTLAYASPEQLSGAQLDHRSDQYALACTLFWLLAGSTPFESGNAAAVIAGHLHYPPPPVSARRAAVPLAMDAVLARALAKQPGERFESCTQFTDAAARALTPIEPTAAAPLAPTAAPPIVNAPIAPVAPPRPQPATPTPPPDSEATIISPPAGPVPRSATPNLAPAEPHSRSKGRWITVAALGVVVALTAAAAIIWATGDSGSKGNSGGSSAGSASAGTFTALGQLDSQGKRVEYSPGSYPAIDGAVTCAPLTLGVAGALTGNDSALGNNVAGGVRLAVDQFTRKNPGCTVTVKEFDTTGHPQTASSLAPSITGDSSIVTLIGPVFSGETKAVGQVLSDAGLPFLTPSASNPTLTNNGWRGFFRGITNDDVTGPALVRFLTESAGYRKICVIGDDSDYGRGLAKTVTTGLGSAALPACALEVRSGTTDFTTEVGKIAAAAPDAVFYAGYATEAGKILAHMRSIGVPAQFVTADGGLDPIFEGEAGSAAAGALVTCACGPATGSFATDYAALVGTTPGMYSAEAYDLTAIVLHGIAAGHTTRADLLTYLHGYSGDGLTRTYRWTATGELTEPRIWLYRAG